MGGTFGYFWVLVDICWYLWVLLSTFGYFWVLEYVSGQELVRKWSENVKKWSEIIRIWSRIDKQTKKKGKIQTIQPERRRREGLQQKKETLNYSSTFLWFNLFLCYFLFFLFKSFHLAR